jgi:amidohydrolase
MPVRNRFAEMLPEITAWRRDLHENPEILFETHRTAGIVAEKLKEFGVDEIVTGIGRTGVVGVIKGKTNTSGRTIGLRADMDALPIHEETGKEYASKTPGAMHACGHDGHTAMLLGAAKYLSETRNFDGTVVVIFQPAEEGGGGGREMVEDGMLDRWSIDEVYGMHNWPGQPLGKFAIRPGPFFAAADLFEIDVTGKGGHAAKPHETIDTTVVASHIVLALQTIASRNTDPVEQVVVSVTSFETATKAHNIIPEKVKMRGTVRTLSPAIRDLAEERMKQIVEGTAATFGATAVLNYIRNYPVTVNGGEHGIRRRGRAQGFGRLRHQRPARHGRRGFRLHAGGTPRRLYPRRHGRGRAGPPPEIRFQRRGHPGGLLVVGGDRGAAVAGGLSGLAARARF